MDRAMMGHMWEEEEFGVKNDHRVFHFGKSDAGAVY